MCGCSFCHMNYQLFLPMMKGFSVQGSAGFVCYWHVHYGCENCEVSSEVNGSV